MVDVQTRLLVAGQVAFCMGAKLGFGERCVSGVMERDDDGVVGFGDHGTVPGRSCHGRTSFSGDRGGCAAVLQAAQCAA